MWRKIKKLFYTNYGNNGVFGPGYRSYDKFDYGKLAVFLSVTFFLIIVGLILILM